MIRVKPRLSRVALSAVFASALCVPASAAPSGEIFVKLPPGSTAARDDHRDHIEILSYSFGAAAGEKGGTEDINIGVGELQEAPARANDRLRNAGPVNGAAPASGDMTLKGQKIGQNAPAPGGVSVAAGDVNGDGTSAASGLPTGKRQHKPFTLTQPLDKGSVMLKLSSAWPDCRVGTRYPELELGDGAKGYRFQDAVVTSCSTESISLNYSKVAVRGWNPEKKEE